MEENDGVEYFAADYAMPAIENVVNVIKFLEYHLPPATHALQRAIFIFFITRLSKHLGFLSKKYKFLWK